MSLTQPMIQQPTSEAPQSACVSSVQPWPWQLNVSALCAWHLQVLEPNINKALLANPAAWGPLDRLAAIRGSSAEEVARKPNLAVSSIKAWFGWVCCLWHLSTCSGRS
jgi:hypothetical protein